MTSPALESVYFLTRLRKQITKQRSVFAPLRIQSEKNRKGDMDMERAKQIKFRDLENDAVRGGIELDSGDVICGCCGGLFEKDDEGTTWQKITEYANWVDLTSEICGSDIDDNDEANSEPETHSDGFKSESTFEDKAICDYYDTIEGAIIEAYEAVTGKAFAVENECEAIGGSRELLCDMFHGCFPAWVDDDDSEEMPCYRENCAYGCATCPMKIGNLFPEFAPESDDAESLVAELIRCVKCNKAYQPSAAEIEAAAEILRNIR